MSSGGVDVTAGASIHRALAICGATDIGSKREQNQDAFVITDLATGRASRPPERVDVFLSRPGVLLLVCDGMGGAPAGDVAANLAAVAIENELRAAANDVARDPGPSRSSAPSRRRTAPSAPRRPRTPRSAAWARRARRRCARPRVSRSCRWATRAPTSFATGGCCRLTRDQTIAARLIDEGVLDPSQLATSRSGTCSCRRSAPSATCGRVIDRPRSARERPRPHLLGWPARARRRADDRGDPRGRPRRRGGHARAHRRRARGRRPRQRDRRRRRLRPPGQGCPQSVKATGAPTSGRLGAVCVGAAARRVPHGHVGRAGSRSRTKAA